VRITRLGVLLLLAPLAGCSSNERTVASTFEFPTEAVRPERVSPDPAPQAAVLVDLDKLRADLGRAVPTGWTIEDPEDQLQAPPGWERLEGDRGLAVKIVDRRRANGGAERSFVLYLFPRGWSGRDFSQGISVVDDRAKKLARARPEYASTDDPVAFYGASRDWLFFHSTKGLGAAATSVAAGWTKPEDDVARALRVDRR
jgi:hypothetical protein